jgi:predicted DNA-binding transcriptional regulator AlpA
VRIYDGAMGRSPGPTPAVRPTPAMERVPQCCGGRPPAAFAAKLAATMPAKTIRLIEIAEILGVTHQRTSVIVRQPAFPAPVGREGQSRVWDRRKVTAWAKVWRREKPWR